MNHDELIEEITDELVTLVKGKARHASHLHESDAARRDIAGHMRWCPGCRLMRLTKRLDELVRSADDTAPQQRHGGKSQRDVVLERWLERRELEQVPDPD